MNRAERINKINKFMGEFSPNIKPKALEARLWPGMIVLTGGTDVHRPFGYSSVQYFSYDDRWSFFYCPEVIADGTIELSDSEFDAWMRYIRAHVSAHINMDTQDEGAVDAQVFGVLPEARDLVARAHDLLFEFS